MRKLTLTPLLLLSLLLALLLPTAANALGPAPGPLVNAGTPGAKGKPYSYSQLLDAIAERKIASAQVDDKHFVILLRLRKGGERIVSYPQGDAELLHRLAASGAVVELNHKSPSALGKWLPYILIGGLIAFFIVMRNKQSRGGAGAMGKAMGLRKNAVVSEIPTVRFTDVAGCDEAVEEMAEMLEFLRNSERFEAVGAKMPSGILVFGPPGTGKTLLAKALAGEAGVPFFATAGSDFVEMFVGVGSKRMRELFNQARTHADGAVIFIDELDAIGRQRGSSGAGSDSEREQTLNQLLVEMDGFAPNSKLIVVAATNRLDVLDAALLRPGRFGRQVAVDLPAEEGRAEILAVHAKGKPFASGVELSALARTSGGMSGAQLAEVVNEAAIMAARADRKQIEQSDLNEGHLRVLMGPEKRSSMLAEGELETVAYHEAGHVLAAELCPDHEKAQRATVKPRGRAAGLALYGRNDRVLQDASFIHQQMICALGGRAAEQVILGKVSSGAANDLQIVNQIARHAIEDLGMSPALGQIVTSDSRQQPLPLSQETRALIDREVERVVAHAYTDALALIESHRPQLEKLKALLVGQGDIERVDILTAVTGVQELELAPVLGTRQMYEPTGVAEALAPVETTTVMQPFRRKGLLERAFPARHRAARRL